MPQIEIDFEVFKAITALRENENVTENDVIRRLVLPDPLMPERKLRLPTKRIWHSKGVDFPVGTELRARYRGALKSAVIEVDGVRVEGELRSNLSMAARKITGNTVNGWNFWEVRFPTDSVWRPAKALRTSE